MVFVDYGEVDKFWHNKLARDAIDAWNEAFDRAGWLCRITDMSDMEVRYTQYVPSRLAGIFGEGNRGPLAELNGTGHPYMQLLPIKPLSVSALVHEYSHALLHYCPGESFDHRNMACWVAEFPMLAEFAQMGVTNAEDLCTGG